MLVVFHEHQMCLRFFGSSIPPRQRKAVSPCSVTEPAFALARFGGASQRLTKKLTPP
jgi:hypothetical protein